MEKVLSGEGVVFVIVYGYHETDNKKLWKPCYKSESKLSISTKSPYKYKFNEFCCQLIDLCPDDKDGDQFKMEFFRSQKNGKHKILGNVLVSLDATRKNPK